MSYKDKLQQIEQLKGTIEKHGKLPDDVLNKINYKFRLEWNYTSNSMEGNSLTKPETRSVMIGNITVEDKPFKDVAEMQGHNEVITTIIKIGKGELNISEGRIKAIHKAIIYEEDVEKAKQIAVWKKVPNVLTNYKGEEFQFVPPDEVHDRMHQLINWLNAEKDKIQREDKSALHPAQLAFQFHLDYVTIHPFLDGNGRTARILTNLILISYGYPPIYIKKDEKDVYYRYLADIQSYGGNPDLFYEFMADLVIRSQQIVLDAIGGKDIEDPDDLDKKIFLLEKELEIIDPEKEIKVHFNEEVFSEMLNGWIKDLLLETISVIQKFNKFFTNTRHGINIGGLAYAEFVNEPANEIISKLIESCNDNKKNFQPYNLSLRFHAQYGALKKAGLNTFGCNYNFEIKFEHIKYEVYVDEFLEEGNHQKSNKMFEKLLHKSLTEFEIEKIVKTLGDSIYQHIDFYTKKHGLR
jgi:Fic family protein